jgi:predicted ATP-grasp superfamily ATP-dependent carboligase
MHGGKIVASFGHRRIREKPPSGGVSVLSESTNPPAALIDVSAALLQALGWDGIAMVEFKLDHESGRHVLMEINGRLWGSLQLAIDAGVDFPGLLVSLALGERPEPQASYRIGVRTRWTLGDFDHLIARLTKSREELRLPPTAPGRLRAAAGFLRAFLPPVESEVMRLSDPRPGLREAVAWIRSALAGA